MSYQDDLDWLARNVHEWPEHTPHVVTDGDSLFEFGAVFCKNHVRINMEDNSGKIFLKDRWLSRRAELQNKPSWDKAESWAEWLAQDSYGCWGFFQKKPQIHALSWIARSGYYQIRSPGNLLLGDWRDTLERRPEAEADITDPFDPEFRSVTVSNETIPLEQPVVVASTGDAIQGKCPNCGNTGIHACLGRKVTHTNTANEIAEWVTKQQAKETSDWHERGELPPVGTECVIWSEGRFPPAECKIVAYSMEQVCVRWNGNGDLDVIDLQFKNPIECKFRPIRLIRTERNALIDAVHSATIVSVHSAEAIADAILAAGFRREGGES